MPEAVLVHEFFNAQALRILRPQRGVEGVVDAQRLLVLVLAAEVVRLLLDRHAFQHDAVGRVIPQPPQRGQAMLAIQHGIRPVLPVADHQHAQLRRVEVLHDTRHVFHVEDALVLLRHDPLKRHALDALLDFFGWSALPSVQQERLLCLRRICCLQLLYARLRRKDRCVSLKLLHPLLPAFCPHLSACHVQASFVFLIRARTAAMSESCPAALSLSACITCSSIVPLTTRW